MTDLKQKLTRMADDLLDIRQELGDSEAADWIVQAGYLIEDAANAVSETHLAVGEVVQSAAHQHGVVGPMPYRVLREAA